MWHAPFSHESRDELFDIATCLDIPQHCQRLLQYLSHRHSQHNKDSFHIHLSSLCSTWFGSNRERGLLSLPLQYHEKLCFLKLLMPTGVLFSYLIQLYQEQDLLYEINVSKLPLSTQQSLSYQQYTSIPHCFRQRLALSSGGRSSQCISGITPEWLFLSLHTPLKPTSTSLLPLKNRDHRKATLFLHIMEYYLYCFLYFILRRRNIHSHQMAQDPKIKQGHNMPRNEWHPTISTLDETSVYIWLLTLYLEYFFPVADAFKKKAISDGSTVVNDNYSGNVKENSIWCYKGLGDLSKMNISIFMISTMVELWLGQFTVNYSPGIRSSRHNRDYELPTADQLFCIKIIIQHFVKTDLRFLSKVTYSFDTCFEETQWNAYNILRGHLYYFLRHTLRYWPFDETYYMIIDIWISFIMPWKECDRGPLSDLFYDEWAIFIADNFAFYSFLLDAFLNRASTLPFSNEEQPKREALDNTPRCVHSNLQLLKQVLRVYRTPYLLTLLRDAEAEILKAQGYNPEQWRFDDHLKRANASPNSILRRFKMRLDPWAQSSKYSIYFLSQLQKLEGCGFELKCIFLSKNNSEATTMIFRLLGEVQKIEKKLTSFEQLKVSRSQIHRGEKKSQSAISALTSMFQSDDIHDQEIEFLTFEKSYIDRIIEEIENIYLYVSVSDIRSQLQPCFVENDYHDFIDGNFRKRNNGIELNWPILYKTISSSSSWIFLKEQYFASKRKWEQFSLSYVGAQWQPLVVSCFPLVVAVGALFAYFFLRGILGSF